MWVLAQATIMQERSKAPELKKRHQNTPQKQIKVEGAGSGARSNLKQTIPSDVA